MALPIWHSGPILRVRNLGPESRVRNFSRPWENPLNQEFLPKPILLAQNLELGEFWGKNDGFKGKFLVLENFLGSGKIPDPRFQTQIPDPMVGSGISDRQSQCHLNVNKKICHSTPVVFLASRRISWNKKIPNCFCRRHHAAGFKCQGQKTFVCFCNDHSVHTLCHISKRQADKN